MPPPGTAVAPVLELEAAIPSTTARRLLEELRKRMPPTTTELRTTLEEEWVSARLRCRVVWIVAVVKPRTEFCFLFGEQTREMKQSGLLTSVGENFISFVDSCHFVLAAALVRMSGLSCLATET